jgi:hypothetical protein
LRYPAAAVGRVLPLTATDIEVLRLGLSSLIQPLVTESPVEVIVLTTSTLMVPLWDPSLARPPFSPPPHPPPFGGPGEHVVSPPQPSPLRSLYAALLSPAERAAWDRRNRMSREIPGLAIARIGNRHSADDVPAGWTVVAASAPTYPTTATAVMYAHFTCRGGCGEGRLIRLARDGASWRITASEQLWIG